MNSQIPSERQSWLQYAPFIYSYISVHPVQDLDSITSLNWLKGLSRNKSSFKFNEGMFMMGGNRLISEYQRGVLSLYNTSIPKSSQLDDHRLIPILEKKSQIIFPYSISHVEEFVTNCGMGIAIGSQMQVQYSIEKYSESHFAVALEQRPEIYLIPMKKWTESPSQSGRLVGDVISGKGGGAVLTGHEGPISKVQRGQLQNGKQTLFSSSLDSTIFQWDLEKLSIQRKFKYHRSQVIDMCLLHEPFNTRSTDIWKSGPISFSSNILATLGLSGQIFLWDYRNKNPVNKMSMKQSTITSLSSSSSEGIITGTNDGKVQFWDLRKKTKYQYETKFDLKDGHHEKITKIKYNFPMVECDLIAQPRNKNLGRINFTTASEDGKIIKWQDKIQFVHEGHITGQKGTRKKGYRICFDKKQNCDLYISSSSSQNALMVWEPGVSLCNIEK